jgi:hypothetical protein
MFPRSFAKLGMNILRKIIFPMKDCNYLMFLGWSNFWMAIILLGSILIPSLQIICPSSLPSSKPKRVFLGFNEIPNFLHFSNTRLRHCKCSSFDFEYVITITIFRQDPSLRNLARATSSQKRDNLEN